QSTLRSVYGNVGMRIRRLRACPCSGSQAHSFSTLFTNKSPITPELRYLTAKMAALLPFRKTAELLGEFLPLSAQATASTVRNRTMKVGRRLQKSAEVLATAASNEPCKELVVGFDGGYVRNRHRRPERNFEVVAGKALDHDGHATCFAFVRNGGSEAVSAVGLALRHCGVNEATSVTVLTDGDAGLRAIHQQVAPQAEHVLDWFHIAMRFTNLQQLAKGINAIVDGGARSHALAEIERAKWRLWNGLAERGIVGLAHLGQWAQAPCFEHIPSLKKLAHTLLETIRYLELNADSMPDYGKRYRAGQRISTGFVESAVNEIVAKRMVKKQQMRWNRYTVQRFLDVRVHVLNGTLEDAFRHWHKGFRPVADQTQLALSA
ncbi:MAG: ISKra4 family transposase, partial [Acidimicrobiales bacterium]